MTDMANEYQQYQSHRRNCVVTGHDCTISSPGAASQSGRLAAPTRGESSTSKLTAGFRPSLLASSPFRPVFLASNLAEKINMAEVLRPMRVSVEKDLSGGVRVGFGDALGLLSPEQAFEFAMVLLDKAGVGVEYGAQFPKPAPKHFRPG